MRKRIILATVVLGSALVGIALAQQDGNAHKQPAPDKAKLRAQLVNLRVEIELLQLDHDADREIIVAWMKSMRQAESMGAQPYGKEIGLSLGMMMLEAKASLGGGEAAKEAERIGAEAGGNFDSYNKALKASAKKEEDSIMAYIARKRKDYAKQAAELALKRLELADAEKRYNE
jgi:hypothetical protein